MVVAAFGVFEATSLARTYEAARTRATRAEILATREQGAAESIFVALGPAADVTWLAETLLEATADLDGTARPLFSGLRDLPVPADPFGRLWRAADLVREHRGDGHLAACIAAGLDVVEMNVLTELWIGYPPGEYSATRRHSPESIDGAMNRFAARRWLEGSALNQAGRDARDAIEAATDASEDRLVGHLGSNTEPVITAAGAWADMLVASGAFTADPRKRAVG